MHVWLQFAAQQNEEFKNLKSMYSTYRMKDTKLGYMLLPFKSMFWEGVGIFFCEMSADSQI